jgi:potassium channel subfamily K protein
MFIFRFRKSKKHHPKHRNTKHDQNDAHDRLPIKKRARRIEQFKIVCKKITTFLFSRVGLCFVVVGYVALGGFIFRAIEGKHEEEKAKNKTLISDVVNTKTDSLVNEIWNMTKFEKVFHEKNYTAKLKARLVEYQRNLTDAVKEGYKGSSDHSTTKWTYPGSILYSVTIVTTIGK